MIKHYKYYFSFLFVLAASNLIAATINITSNTNWSSAGIGSTDNVIIKNGATLTVNSATAVCKNIQIGSTTAPSAGTGTLAFNVGSILDVSQTVTMGEGANSGTIVMTSGGYFILKTLSYTLGTLTYGIGTLEFANTATLPSQLTNFYNLTFNKNNGTLSLSSNLTIYNNLLVNDGSINTTTSNFNLTVHGTATINTGEKLELNGSTLTLKGNFVNNGTFVYGTSSTVFDGTTAISGSTITEFNNITINSAKTISLSNDIKIRGNLTNNGGTFTHGSKTVTFNGTSSQQINGTSTSITFYNLIVNKTVGTNLSIGGNLSSITASNDLTLTTGNFLAPASLIVNGNFLHSAGTYTAGTNAYFKTNFTRNAGTFTHNSGSITFDGTGSQSIAGIVTSTFYNMTVNKAGGDLTLSASNLILNNKLTMTSGTFNVGTNTLDGAGGITATGGVITFAKLTTVPELTGVNSAYAISGGTLTLNGTGAQTLRGNVAYYNLNLSTSGIKTTSNVTSVLNNLSITGSATMNANSALTVGGTFSISSSGTTTLTAATNIIVGNFSQSAGTFIDSGVEIKINGLYWSRTGGTFTSTGKVLFESSGSQSIGGTSSTDFYKLYKAGAGTLTLNVNTTINNELNISAGTLNAGTYTFSGTANVNISGGEIKIGKTGVVLPEFTGNYSNTGGIIELNGTGSATIRKLNYFNLEVLGTGIKTFSADTTGIAGALTVEGSTVNTLTNNSTIFFNGTGSFANQNINALDYHGLGFGTLGVKTFGSGASSIRGNLWTQGAIGDALTNSCEMTFNGSALQSISAAAIPDFYKITIDNAFGVNTSGTINLHHTLTLAPNAIFSVGGTFLLKSNITRTARIALVPASATFSGNIEMERYMPAIPYFNNGFWHMVGAPSSGSGFTAVTYDESVTGGLNNGYVFAPTAIAAGQGGFRSFGASASTQLFSAAPPNIGPISINTSLNVSAGPAEDGWNLISNPYPSEILWSATGISLTNVGSAAYMWDGTQYQTFVFGDNVEVPSCQGVWVKATGTGSVAFDETAKSSGNPSYLKMATFNYPRLVLKMSGATYTDITDVRFIDGATDFFDPAYDALKLSGISAAPYLATKNGDSLNAAISAYPELNSAVHIPLIARCTIGGTYSISVESISNFANSSCLYLEDLITGDLYDLKTISSFNFTINASSGNEARFIIHIGAPMIVNVEDATCNNGNYFGSANAFGVINGPWIYEWKNSNGDIISTSASINLLDSLNGLTSGSYSVTIYSNTGYCSSLSEEFFVAGSSPILSGASVSDAGCFGSSDGGIDLSPTGGALPYTYLWNGTIASQNLSNLVAGTYNLSITDANACVFLESMIVDQEQEIISTFIPSVDTVYLSLNPMISFTNNSLGADSYEWDFGDGSQVSAAINPVYFYQTEGNFIVRLTAINGVCSEISERNILVLESPLSTTDKNLSDLVNVYSKDGNIIIDFDFHQEKSAMIRIYNLLGQTIFEDSIQAFKESIQLDITKHANTFYIVNIAVGNEVLSAKVAKFLN